MLNVKVFMLSIVMALSSVVAFLLRRNKSKSEEITKLENNAIETEQLQKENIKVAEFKGSTEEALKVLHAKDQLLSDTIANNKVVTDDKDSSYVSVTK